MGATFYASVKTTAICRVTNSNGWETTAAARRTALAGIGISCWHKSLHESAALWELYLPRGLGVAVKSTTTRLREGLQGSTREIDAVQLNYEDYTGLEVSSDVRKLLSFKRREFKHESEIRFLLTFNPDEIYEMNELYVRLEDRQTRRFHAGVRRPFYGWVSIGPERPAVTADPDGVHLDSDLEHIIDKVVLAPNVTYATRRAIIAVTGAFGLDRKLVVESSLDHVPYDQVSFF